MTATFNNTLPTALDRVRRAVGDVDTVNALRQDEEITALLTLYADDEALVISQIAGSLAVEFAQKPDSFSDDGTSISWRERVKTWLTIADNARASSVTVTGISTGVWSEQLIREGVDGYESEYDPNRVEPGW